MRHVPFVKMHASGNDFIVIDNRHGKVVGDVTEFVRRVCRRHYSVGADGLILIENSNVADFRWQFFNMDGGEVEMCGNGSRCAARYAYMKGITGRSLRFETVAGIIEAEVMDDTVKVQLTMPTGFVPEMSIDLGGVVRPASFINTGVPHVVYFVDDLDAVDVMGEGSLTRYHERFAPEGTNANFARVADRGSISVRTYERGVEGETQACGTGAVAAALIAGAKGLVDSPVSLTTRGGNVLSVYFSMENGGFPSVFLEGDAVMVFHGELADGALL